MSVDKKILDRLFSKKYTTIPSIFPIENLLISVTSLPLGKVALNSIKIWVSHCL